MYGYINADEYGIRAPFYGYAYALNNPVNYNDPSGNVPAWMRDKNGDPLKRDPFTTQPDNATVPKVQPSKNCLGTSILLFAEKMIRKRKIETIIMLGAKIYYVKR